MAKKTEKDKIYKKNSSEIIATMSLIVVMIAASAVLFYNIYSVAERQCWDSLKDTADLVSVEIVNHIEEDRQILHIMADVFAGFDDIEDEKIINYINNFVPRTLSSYIALILPDDRVILPGGIVVNSELSFEKEVEHGVHVSDRKVSIMDESKYVVRNYVPVVKNGETVAMLYGVISLETFSEVMNLNRLGENGGAFLFDGNTGDDLINTWHPTGLGNAFERGARPVKRGYDYEQMQIDSFDGKTGYIIFESKSRGGWLYYYYRPVDINNWTMAIAIAESVAFADAMLLRNILIIFICIEVLALLCYLLWMLWHVKKVTLHERAQNVILEEALQRAEKAGKAKSTFLSNMSHDIRTPMNAIIGFTTIAQNHIDEKDRVRDCLGKISASGNHLLALINDVLDMSKIENDDIHLNTQECNLSDAMRNLTNIIQAQVMAKELDFSIEGVNLMHEKVYADTLRLNQVLLNVVGNAIKYTEPGGSVTLRLEEKAADLSDHRSYVFSVKDSGIGMSEDYLPKIFDVFTREKREDISHIEGTGLGLPIAKRIVEMAGGEIDVKSELGKGTEITIALPLRLQNAEQPQFFAQQLKGKNVLVVDSADAGQSVVALLEQAGMQAQHSQTTNSALLRAQQAIDSGNPFSAYIVDWIMQDTAELELIKELRALAGAKPPIIVLTTYDYYAIKEKAQQAGASAFYQKPLFVQGLSTVLLDALGFGIIAGVSQVAEAYPTKHFAGKRILLAEDNELNREIAIEILKDTKLEIETAVNGRIAFDMLKNSKPGYYDAILMDVQMPVMNGYEATRAIRQLEDENLANIPIAAMTANAFEEDRQEAFKNGMNAHITKPIDPKEVMDTLEKLILKQ